MFAGRTLVIATMHGKERVIAPLLEQHLHVRCTVVERLDTDQLGTFTGEIERVLDPLEAARRKCELAMELTGADLAVASEGSFGAHPSLFFAAADDELVVLVDRLNGVEIVGRELSTDTNFDSAEITSEQELRDFAERVGFPEHALILRAAKAGELAKGLHDWDALLFAYRRMVTAHGKVTAETDMRAMHNPRRMQVIAQAAQRMVERALVTCAECRTPGFGLVDIRRGLPCGWCGTPTEGVLALVNGCAKCGHREELPPPDGRASADPQWCPVCNP